MPCVKILHCADLHLGFDYVTLGLKAARRRAELVATLQQIVQLCKQEQVQMLLIAGDLFDGVKLPQGTVQSVQAMLASLEQVPVVIAPGNHDPLTEDSPYRREGWPENVHILGAQPQAVVFPALGVRVWGTAFSGAVQRERLLPCVPAKLRGEGLVQIGVQHGDLVSGSQPSLYAPLNAQDIANSGLDYLALGHVHKRSEVLRAGATAYAYAGSPEGHGFDECGPRGVYVGTVEPGRCDLHFCPTQQRLYGELSVDLSGAQTAQDMAQRVLHALQSQYGQGWNENLYKIVLTGTLAQGVQLDTEAIRAALPPVFFFKLRDHTRPLVDFTAEEGLYTLRGRFLSHMRPLLAASAQDAAAQQAVSIGLRAFQGEVNWHADTQD